MNLALISASAGAAVDDLVGGDAGDGGAEERARVSRRRPPGCPGRRPRAAPRSPARPRSGSSGTGCCSRSVTSAVSRAKSSPMVPSARTASAGSSFPSVRTRIMKNSSSSSCGSSVAVLPPSKPRGALGVEPPPAEPAAQVGRVDRGEAALGVDVLDPGPHVERVVVLLELLVGVQRLAVAERPLALTAARSGPATAAGRAGARGGLVRLWGVIGAFLRGRRTTRGADPSTLREDRLAATGARWTGVSAGGRSRLGPERPDGRLVSAANTSCCGCARSPRGVEPRGRCASQRDHVRRSLRVRTPFPQPAISCSETLVHMSRRPAGCDCVGPAAPRPEPHPAASVTALTS